MSDVIYSYFASPVGKLLLTSNGSQLTGVHFPNEQGPCPQQASWYLDEDHFWNARSQLSEYFAGVRRAFDLSFAAVGTPFEQCVWRELTEIPYGVTVSYRDMARRIGRPTAFRAVGLANGRNPIPIIVPCHRVIGANGSLTGYGGGLERKRWLLELEGVVPVRPTLAKQRASSTM